jgi:hypothetical protein
MLTIAINEYLLFHRLVFQVSGSDPAMLDSWAAIHLILAIHA